MAESVEARFCAAIADVLEVGSIGLDDDFRAVGGWCSLKAFGILVTLENDWGTPLAIDRFQRLKTVRDLLSVVSAPLASPVSRLAPSSQPLHEKEKPT